MCLTILRYHYIILYISLFTLSTDSNPARFSVLPSRKKTFCVQCVDFPPGQTEIPARRCSWRTGFFQTAQLCLMLWSGNWLQLIWSNEIWAGCVFQLHFNGPGLSCSRWDLHIMKNLPDHNLRSLYRRKVDPIMILAHPKAEKPTPGIFTFNKHRTTRELIDFKRERTELQTCEKVFQRVSRTSGGTVSATLSQFPRRAQTGPQTRQKLRAQTALLSARAKRAKQARKCRQNDREQSNSSVRSGGRRRRRFESRGERSGATCYNIFFLRMSGPTLSPVSSLCFKWDLSQTGN